MQEDDNGVKYEWVYPIRVYGFKIFHKDTTKKKKTKTFR